MKNSGKRIVMILMTSMLIVLLSTGICMGAEANIQSNDENKSINLSECSVEPIEDQNYTGDDITPEVIMKYGEYTLIQNTDYTLTYYDNLEVGEAKVIVTGSGDYTGEREVLFNIKNDIKEFTVTDIKDQSYNGTAIKPTVTVMFGDEVLTEDKDYSVAYMNNVNAGNSRVEIIGMGDYEGIKSTKEFIIKPAKIKTATLSASSYTYNNKVKAPTAKVIGSLNNNKLVSGSDYTVKYGNGRKAVGKYTVTISGKGNYSGTVVKSFTIRPSKAALKNAVVTSKKMKVSANAKASAYGGYGLQIAYRTNGGAWKYAATTSNTKTVKVANKKKYTIRTRAYKKVGNTTYFGDWSRNITSVKKIKVSFNANKGKVKTKSKKVWSNGKYGKLPKAKRSGYKFKGWYTKKKGGKKVTAKTYSRYYNNHTLYAHWFGPKGRGGTITKSEFKRIKYGMSYSQVCYLIGGKGSRTNSYTDSDWIDESHEEWVDTSYWDYDYDYNGSEYSYWVNDGYWDTVYDGYWEEYYHETYSFEGQRSGYVDFEFVDNSLEEIYTYGFK